MADTFNVKREPSRASLFLFHQVLSFVENLQQIYTERDCICNGVPRLIIGFLRCRVTSRILTNCKRRYQASFDGTGAFVPESLHRRLVRYEPGYKASSLARSNGWMRNTYKIIASDLNGIVRNSGKLANGKELKQTEKKQC